MERETTKRAKAQHKQLLDFIDKFEGSLESSTSSATLSDLLDEIKDVAKSFEQ